MPVVQKKSDLYKTQPLLGEATPDPARARGQNIIAAFTVANAADDLATSQFLLADLPSDCILGHETWFKVDAWGFATVNIGTKALPTALITILKSAGTYVTPLTKGDAKHGVALWEALGLAKDPGGTIGIYATGPANATGAGSMKGEFHYRYR
jgi:hypothetical protein